MKKNIYCFIGIAKTNKTKGYYYANIYVDNEVTSLYSDVLDKDCILDSYIINLTAIKDITKKISKLSPNHIIFYVSDYDLAQDFKDNLHSRFSNEWREILKHNIEIKYKDDFAKCIDKVARCKH